MEGQHGHRHLHAHELSHKAASDVRDESGDHDHPGHEGGEHSHNH